jgi:N-acetylglucosamine kinase-like BadF-type ATPase
VRDLSSHMHPGDTVRCLGVVRRLDGTCVVRLALRSGDGPTRERVLSLADDSPSHLAQTLADGAAALRKLAAALTDAVGALRAEAAQEDGCAACNGTGRSVLIDDEPCEACLGTGRAVIARGRN